MGIKMKKNVIAVLLMTVAMVCMTACGGSGAETGNDVESETAEVETESGTEYVFEAEYTVLEGLEGLGVSGSPTGIGLAKEAEILFCGRMPSNNSEMTCCSLL